MFVQHPLRKMSTRLACFAWLALLPLAVAGFVPSFLGVGSCKNLALQPNFEPAKFQGYWFDIRRVPNEYTEVADCISNIATYSESGNALNITNTGLDSDGNYKVGKGTSMIPNVVTGPRMPANMKLLTDPYPPYMIVSTDYTSYACIYSCMQFSLFNAEFMWIYSRTPKMSKDRELYCMWLFEQAEIDTGAIINITHGETCPYYSKLGMMLEHNEKLFKEWGMEENISSPETFNEMIASGKKPASGVSGPSVCDSEPNLCPWLKEEHNGTPTTKLTFFNMLAIIVFAIFVER